MNKYSLIFSDIDGTLLDKNRELATDTISQIQRVGNTYGIPFILASARMPKAMTHLQQTLAINEALICFNGALIIDKNGAVLFDVTIPYQPLDFVNEFTTQKDLHLSLYIKDEWLVNKHDYWAKREENNTKVQCEVVNMDEKISHLQATKKGPHKILVMGDEKKMDELEKILRLDFSDQIAIYRSKETYIEINVIDASKKNALALICQHRGIAQQTTIAFGDNHNDVEMLTWAGVGVAVGNSQPEVLKVADKITATNKENGVALFLRDFFPEK